MLFSVWSESLATFQWFMPVAAEDDQRHWRATEPRGLDCNPGSHTLLLRGPYPSHLRAFAEKVKTTTSIFWWQVEVGS